MKRTFILIILSFSFILLAVPVLAQGNDPLITSPQPSQYVQGIVEILGTNNIAEYENSELAFAYMEDTSTWFLISNDLPVVENDLLGSWDTTNLTDGDYTLRLRINLTGGTLRETFVEDVRVRNYTSLPTETPIPATATVPVPSATSIPATVTPPYPAPTPFPANPLTVSMPNVYANLGKGALLVLGLFILVGLILRARR